MSRNKEKANSLLFRFQQQQAAKNGYIDFGQRDRPRNVSKVDNLRECEGFRKQILQEIKQKVLQIHDEVLPDYRIRDLNDSINKLMKEKRTWEYRIKELGGPDYLRSGGNGSDGGVVIRGYSYYGRAKDLPGVREIIEQQKKDKLDKQQSKHDLLNSKLELDKLISRADLEYYGYLDEEEVGGGSRQNSHDPLLKYERKISRKRQKMAASESTTSSITPEMASIMQRTTPVSQQEIEKFLVEKRKQELAIKYNLA